MEHANKYIKKTAGGTLAEGFRE